MSQNVNNNTFTGLKHGSDFQLVDKHQDGMDKNVRQLFLDMSDI